MFRDDMEVLVVQAMEVDLAGTTEETRPGHGITVMIVTTEREGTRDAEKTRGTAAMPEKRGTGGIRMTTEAIEVENHYTG